MSLFNSSAQAEETTNKTPQFDKERLSKEINEFFQKLSAQEAEAFEKILYETTDFHLKAAQNGLGEVIKANLDVIKNEIMRNGTTIQLPNLPTFDIELSDHPVIQEVIASINLFKKVLLVGPAGTGKTYMIEQLAQRMNLPFYKYSCSRDSSVHDLLGYKQPTSETYLNTTFINAYENGGIFLVDEYDAMSGDMALFFNGVADDSSFISIPHRDTAPTAQRHKDFILVMAGNTWGSGSSDYSGRDFQDQALLDRFRLSKIFVGYHYPLEKAMLGSNYPVVMAVRKKMEEFGSYISTRNIKDIALVAKSANLKTAINLLVQDMEKHEAKAIKSVMTTST